MGAKRYVLFLIPILAVILTGCPKVIPGHTIRIEEIDMLCRRATLIIVAFQGNEAIGNFDAIVESSDRAEFVIPQGVAQRIDFSRPVRLIVALKQGGSPECFLARRNLVFEGKLIRTGTDPRSGNPIYTLNFWEDFKIEYR
ncbi:MAG: hypothetical protein N3E42_00355 [Candidatus Bipolaricaulota bacterium]|nr:hypothetical protein [Candidatus Bipolaricaulota bacterium]